jgi:hypothetical protein
MQTENNTAKKPSVFISAATLRGSRSEILFYLTFLVTIVHAGFILWDYITLLPGVPALIGLALPNTVWGSPTISTLYLALLASYAGYKEFKRWMESDDAIVSEAQADAFRRGEAIIVFWVLFLLVAAASAESLHIIPRLPYELFRTTMQVLAIMLGSYASRKIKQSKLKKKKTENDAEIISDETALGAASNYDERKQKVIEHLKTNPYIDNELCRNITGMDRHQAYRFLESLEKDGELPGEGKGKGRIYKLADKVF